MTHRRAAASLRYALAPAALVALLTGGASAPGAQEIKPATVQPTDAQVQLYEKATEAYQAEDWPKTIELLRSSLALGELNVVYLNLGRALFRSGQCDQAEDAYAKALTAPRVEGLDVEDLKARIVEYRAELSACPGTLELVCNPPEMTVSIDGKVPVPCGQELLLAPGEHVLTASDGQLTAQTRVVVTSRQRQRVELDAAPKAEAPPVERPTSLLVPIGVGTTLVGVGLLAGGVVVDQVVLDDTLTELEDAILAGDEAARKTARDDADGLQTTVLILYAAGGVVTLGGVVLTTLGLLDDGPAEEPPAAHLAPWITPDGSAGVSWQGAW
jgi:hypothetical protein